MSPDVDGCFVFGTLVVGICLQLRSIILFFLLALSAAYIHILKHVLFCLSFFFLFGKWYFKPKVRHSLCVLYWCVVYVDVCFVFVIGLAVLLLASGAAQFFY